jgi:hypothetical protein
MTVGGIRIPKYDSAPNLPKKKKKNQNKEIIFSVSYLFGVPRPASRIANEPALERTVKLPTTFSNLIQTKKKRQHFCIISSCLTELQEEKPLE